MARSSITAETALGCVSTHCGASETVTVTEAPPLVNTSTAELGRTIEQDEIVGLPLVNRNVYTELSLTPGVMANSASSITNPKGQPNFQVGLAAGEQPAFAVTRFGRHLLAIAFDAKRDLD